MTSHTYHHKCPFYQKLFALLDTGVCLFRSVSHAEYWCVCLYVCVCSCLPCFTVLTNTAPLSQGHYLTEKPIR